MKTDKQKYSLQGKKACMIVSVCGLDFPISQHNHTRLCKSCRIIKHTNAKININNLTFSLCFNSRLSASHVNG